MRFLTIVILVLAILTACSGCRSRPPTSTCIDCHKGLEAASPAHADCVSCHGGKATEKDKKASHAGMYGPRNPSDPRFWEQTCGRCHPYQLKRLRSNLMFTNSGMIKNIQRNWEGEDDSLYASGGDEQLFDAAGNPLIMNPVAGLDNLAGELYRKFCSLCHVRIENTGSWAASHASGCAACHFSYNDNATYQGNDQAMQGKWPHSSSHKLAALPDNDVCTRCHNRSGRIALTYQGLNDGNNGLVPTRAGLPGPRLLSGVRNATAIVPDIHFSKGMDCIDCHTSRDVMGDGYAYENMYHQTEISCEDCHGSSGSPPRYAPVTRENEEPLRESKNYQRQVRMGDLMVLTAKGRKYSNVFYEEDKVWVVKKRDGKRLESKVITATPEHTIVGHQRLECYSCHSKAVPQCYGCHTQYDRGGKMLDNIKGVETPGSFSETEDYRRLYPFPLALNQRGKISPVTPGCQTFVTVLGTDGTPLKQEYVSIYQGKPQLRFAPFYSHNTGKKAVGCGECHGNPVFLGFGQHVVEGDSIKATMLCEKSEQKPLDGFLTMEAGQVRSFSAVIRENSRPLLEEEVRRVWAVNQCLICHSDPKDPIYQNELDYHVLESCLDRAVPAGR
jgi:hypothetical protein